MALGGREAITDIAGHFSLDASPGEQVLSARAFGYALHEQSVVLRVDTTVAIALQPTPVELDPLMVENRTVTVRGEVYEAGTDIGLLGVDIIAGAEEDVTNGVGRFKVDAPAGPPVRLSVRAFGYLPIETMVSVFEDTTFVFELERDPVMQQMIARQVARIEERAKPRLTTIMPAMDREYLVRNRNATALDLIRYRYGQFLTRVRCILIDDRQTYNGLGELALYLPDELERIEVLERGQMLRIYTRDFIRDMVSGEVYLPTPVITPSRRPLCR